MATPSIDAKPILARWDSMKAKRSTWDGYWQRIADYVMPRKAQINRSSTGAANDTAQLFDTTAVYANQTLANGMLAYMTPADGQWFSFSPPASRESDDEVSQWLQRCTEIVQRNLANSNFYSEIHELYFDDGGFGTGTLIALPGKSAALNFQALQIGSYCIAEDDERLVNTLFRELKLTAEQAADRFGEERLSEKLRKELAKIRETGKGCEQEHCFLHAVYPRRASEREPGKMDGKNKAFASVYIETDSRHVVSVGGFDEKPFFATRHARWGSEVWGISPSWMALPEARQLNELVKSMDALAEVKAWPRILAPGDMEGEMDLGASGVTFFDPSNPQAIPREWAASGDYNIGLEREKRKQDAIERAYHVPLFNMFSQIERQMTAREVAERSAEKLNQFTPAFTRKTTELLTPLLRCVFNIHLRGGMFPPPPAGMVEQGPDGVAYLAEPEISYNSRVALAMKAQANLAASRSMEGSIMLAQFRPEVLDHYDVDRITRDGARNDGLPADWLLPAEKVESIRKARAEAQQAAAAQQQALAAAEVAQKAGSVKPDSLAGQAVQQQQA
ncbi:bacteriophage head to tail connecting protein [Terrimicrobium sacchariphilum]|uniref:Bacteriophage head to tail connecting protein n=1 Tax=Terrimicrobium sacchariphilum TaxID=690879 RepID=A0A146GE61_TERSA|nr:portal protein [Terrimicrobium sacchariphilum]GAT35611.1 bacteriophage head to tail connecting protein [Terrimicrobium sacchariphilum]